MKIQSLDHVNIRTANLDAMIAWYGDILDMHPGKRPPFSIGGAWLYAFGSPIVHLVEVGAQPKTGDVTLEHFAVSATGMAGFVAMLKDRGVPYTLDPVPSLPMVQVNIHDPDGNHIHVDFHSDEAKGLL